MDALRTLSAVLIVALGFPGAAWSASPGTTSADFLELGAGPRATAMGNAQVAVADDVYSTYWNPAGLAQLQTTQVGFVQTEYLQDISEQYAAFAHPTASLGTWAGSFTYLNVGTFQGYDAVGQPTGAVGANDAAFALSYGLPLYRDPRYGTQLSAGLTGKWIQERLDTVSARAYAADGGLLFEPGKRWGDFLEGWKIGLDVRNMGTSMKFDQESFALPESVTAGVSYTGTWRDEAFTVALDGQQPNDGPRALNAGVELLTLKTFVLRAGYSSRGDLGNGLRAGAGLRFRTIQIDYSFEGAGTLGNVNRIGVTLFFGQKAVNTLVLAEDWYERGMKDFRHERYSEALVEFNRALAIDPAHPQALEMMKQTYEKLKQTNPE